MSILFQQTDLAGMALANRFVRSATWEGLAGADGSATPELAQFLADLADGGVGLIITGHAYVERAGQAAPKQIGADRDDLIPGLRDLTDAVHKKGGMVCLQLAHGGAFTRGDVAQEQPKGPSIIMDAEGKPLCRAMTQEEIAATAQAFGQAAARAKRAGFDAVQVHAAHGYLLSQFLSPVFNKREDGYGGDIMGRTRFLNETVGAVRDAVGPDYPVLVKMNSQDYAEGGLTVDEALLVARRLENQGVSAVEFSGGLLTAKKDSPARVGNFTDPDRQAWYREAAARFKRERAIPLILVGGVRSLDVAEELVAGNVCDYVALSRPLIREPGLINRWKSGDRTPSTCLSDNLCFRTAASNGLSCAHDQADAGKGS